MNPLTKEQKDQALINFAILMHDRSAEEIKAFCDAWKVPKKYRDFALLAREGIGHYVGINLVEEIKCKLKTSQST